MLSGFGSSVKCAVEGVEVRVVRMVSKFLRDGHEEIPRLYERIPETYEKNPRSYEETPGSYEETPG